MTNLTKPIGTIYKLVNSVDDMIYIGATTRSYLRHSLALFKHKAESSNDSKKLSKVVQHIRKLGADAFDMEVIQTYEHITMEQLKKREFKEISKYDSSILLNTDLVYKTRPVEVRDKMKEARFKRGCVSHRICVEPTGLQTNRVNFSWMDYSGEAKKMKMKSWSVKKYGIVKAWKLAKDFRDEMYPLDL